MQIDIAVYDGFDELDVFGPLEPLRAAGAFSVRLVTLEEQQVVTGAFGSRVIPDGIHEPGADVFIMPGGGWVARADRGAWAEARTGRWAPAIQRAAGAGTVLAAVCTGAMILAGAGVLAGRRATTHHDAWGDLEAAGVHLVRERVVDDGDRVTAGGVTSGIDLGLWLTERFVGPEPAERAAERLEYGWQRPTTVPGR
jgi:transcriptional regulator GlxA family with amidase domain